MLSILGVLLVLSFLVIIHELGHFFAAKWCKVTVEEFGLGYPPLAKKLFRKWQTDFTLNWIPFGGFVRMEGEDVDASEAATPSSTNKPGPFFAKPAWQKLLIIMAGVAVNFMFGIVAFGMYFSISGLPVFTADLLQDGQLPFPVERVSAIKIDDDVRQVTSKDELLQLLNGVGARIDIVAPASPADQAGLKPGMKLTQLQVEGQDPIQLSSVESAVKAISEHRGQEVTLSTIGPCQGFVCQGQESELRVYVRQEAEVPANQGAIGVVFSHTASIFFPPVEMVVRGSWFGLQQALYLSYLIYEALIQMVVQLVTRGSVPAEVAGPVGIVHQTQQAGILKDGPLSVLNFAGLISINLAVMNLLPIPALDGGRAVFILLGLVLGKRRVSRVETIANYLGYGLLLGLLVAVTIKDVLAIV